MSITLGADALAMGHDGVLDDGAGGQGPNTNMHMTEALGT